mgnify:CR=1 FL=1
MCKYKRIMNTTINLIKRIKYYLISIKTLLIKVPLKVLWNMTFNKETVLKLDDGASFKLRNKFDLWVVKETYLDEDYRIDDDLIAENPTIIDIGAYIGDYAIWAAKKYLNSKVYAIEPVKENYDLVLENIENSSLSNIKPYRLALHSSETEQYLKTKNISLSQSFIAQNEESMDEKSPSMSLKNFMKVENIKKCHILKMDCEGSEYDILLNSEITFLKEKFDNIILEYHTHPEYSYKDLVKHLESADFEVEIIAPKFENGTGFMKAKKSK